MSVPLDRDKALLWLEKRLGRWRKGKHFHNFNCPFCGDTKYRFGVNLVTRKCYCFRCEVRGTVKKILGLHMEAGKALPGNRLAHAAKRLAPSAEPKSRPWKELPGPGEKVPVLAEPVFAYLEGRGIDRVTAHVLGLGYGIAGKWRNRAIHPFFHNDGRLAGWQGRAISDSMAVKTLTTTEFDLPGCLTPDTGALYGLEGVRRGEPVVVCEGPYDALSVACVQPAVAILGSNLHPAQVRRLMKAGASEIIVGFDPDKPKAALKACATIYQHSRTIPSFVRWEDGLDGEVDFGALDSDSVAEVLTSMVERWRLGLLR